MQKKRWLGVIALLSIAFTTGCKGFSPDSGNSSNQIEVKDPSYEIWSTYNTMRVVQDPELNGNYEKQDAKITAQMAKNELESAQLFITTNDMSFEYFELKAANLENENGDVLPADQVDIYVQHYVNITERSPGTNLEEYPLGYMPDGLIPMELSIGYKENSIGENCNQGITIDFIATKDTPAGTYRGDFVLALDDEEINIPVELTVWDFALPEDSTCKSCVFIYEKGIKDGEMTTVDIDELYKNYYDVLLRYKMNALWVPYAMAGVDAFVDSVLEYWDHPNFQTYGMPHYTFLGTHGITISPYDYYKQVMIALAHASTEDKILYDKLYFHCVDEPGSANGTWANLVYWDGEIKRMKQEVKDELLAEGFFNDKTEEFKEKFLYSLENIQHVSTTTYGGVGSLLPEDHDVTFCTVPSAWEKYSEELRNKEHADKNNNEMWYYCCVSPTTPYPTQFIDDFLITTREMKWMQKYYEHDAFLYWSASSASFLNAKDYVSQNINPYETAHRFEIGNIPNGDGYLLLAGARYDSEYPMATQRLLLLREGQDDLDMINYLDSIYAGYNDYYGLPAETISFNSVHHGLFDRMFCRSISYRSDSILDENREIVAQTILTALSADDKFVYTIDYEGNYATYKFYAANGFGISVNGEALNGATSGSGNVYTYKLDLTKDTLLSSIDVTSSNSSRTVKLYDDAGTKAVDIMNVATTVTEGSTVTKEAGCIKLDIRSKAANSPVEMMRFSPKASMDVSGDFRTIELDLVNNKDAYVSITLILIGENGNTYQADISLTGNVSCTVEMLNRLPDGEKVKSIELRFLNGTLNGDDVILEADRSVSISGIRLK